MADRRRILAGACVAGLVVLGAGRLAGDPADESLEQSVDEPFVDSVDKPVGKGEPGALPAVPPPTAEVPGWSFRLAEDFATVDPKLWTLKDDTYSSNEDSFLSAANCSIDQAGADGHALRLQGRKQLVRKWGRTWRYTSCYATTEGKYSLPDYFRAEVRARVPMEQGMWAAPLWFRPADDSGGEIDLVETLGSEAALPQVHQAIHTDYGRTHEQAAITHPFRLLDDPAGTSWHTYTIEKVPGRITMWVDDVQTAEWSGGDPLWFARYYDAGKRWNLRINLQIGGPWAGRPDATTDWSADRTAVLVDHVYVWTPTPAKLRHLR